MPPVLGNPVCWVVLVKCASEPLNLTPAWLPPKHHCCVQRTPVVWTDLAASLHSEHRAAGRLLPARPIRKMCFTFETIHVFNPPCEYFFLRNAFKLYLWGFLFWFWCIALHQEHRCSIPSQQNTVSQLFSTHCVLPFINLIRLWYYPWLLHLQKRTAPSTVQFERRRPN